jgi:hypothetical protein
VDVRHPTCPVGSCTIVAFAVVTGWNDCDSFATLRLDDDLDAIALRQAAVPNDVDTL